MTRVRLFGTVAPPTIDRAPREVAQPSPGRGTREHGTPKPAVDDWRERGACRGKPAKLWYTTEPTAAYREGRAICASCPVRKECLEWALDTAEAFGLWGGVSPRGRSKLLRERDQAPLRQRQARAAVSLRGKR